MGENNFRACEEVQHNRVFVAEGRRKYSIYALSGHDDLISDPDIGKAFKYHAQYPGVMQGSQEGKRAKLWGPRAHFGANISMKIVSKSVGMCRGVALFI